MRSFTIKYKLSGLAIAYDDVVDVNFQVWGDEWQEPLGQLSALMLLPGDASGEQFFVWGHPVSVRGDTTKGAVDATLRAENIPAEQFVEMRVVFPRDLLTSTAGAQVRSGNALERIVAEERSDAREFEENQRKINDAKDHLGRTLLILFGLAVLPALAVIGGTWWFYGRERRTSYDREYEQEPPSDLEPALVPTLLRQSTNVGATEFTATLFDLIRRGRYKSTPVTTEKAIWGGLRKENVADLELSPGEELDLKPFERAVEEVADSVMGSGSQLLSNFRDEIAADRETNSKRFERFKSRVDDAVTDQKWLMRGGLLPLIVALVLFAVTGAIMFAVGVASYSPIAPTWANVVVIALSICLIFNAALLFVSMFFVRLWRRRSAAIEGEAERWEAFRRFLSDFPRLQDAPPASLELWERYLVYGIAFGIAERVLQARAAPDARGAARREHGLLDQPDRRPRLRPDRARDRRPLGRLRQRARPAVERLGRWRRRLLRRRWRWRRRWRRRRRLVATCAGGARRAPRFRPSRRSATRKRR